MMTGSCRCSDLLPSVLVAIILTAFIPQQAHCRQSVWDLPHENEVISAGSVTIGSSFVRDTYLSASRYDGLLIGLENDRWKGLLEDGVFSTGRSHASLMFSSLTNRNDGGRTLELTGTAYKAWLWHAVDCNKCDLLVGPACMIDIDILYNMQNTNNPINAEGYLAAGLCVDNTFRYNVRNYPMALQATLYIPLAGIGIAPDYDQPYWLMYRYGEYGKALHFISPFNNPALSQQIALVLPVLDSRLRIGYTFDFMRNSLGGHSTYVLNGTFSIGYAVRFQTKRWGR